jgi:ABC-type nitrate/sulfonate/bicarbonate transport system permease component
VPEVAKRPYRQSLSARSLSAVLPSRAVGNSELPASLGQSLQVLVYGLLLAIGAGIPAGVLNGRASGRWNW